MGWQGKTIFGIRIGVLMMVAMAIVVLLIMTVSIVTISSSQNVLGPGLRYEPALDQGYVHYHVVNETKNKEIIDRLNKVLNFYNLDKRNSQRLSDCSPNLPPDPSKNEVCVFKKEWIGENCSEAVDFGYGNNRQPCIFLLYNEIDDWIPDPYQSLDELPDEMPEDLQNHIAEVTKNNDGKVPQMLWIHCEGEKQADKEYMGSLQYHSPWNGWQGFPTYYFPFRYDLDYMPPILTIQLPHLASDFLVHLECRAWCKNIAHSKSSNLGMATIKILSQLQK